MINGVDEYGYQAILAGCPASVSGLSNVVCEIYVAVFDYLAKGDLKNFDLEQMIGENCQVQIVHSTSDDGRVWANVKAIVPLSKGMLRLEIPDDFTRKTDRMDVDLPAEHAPF